MNEMQKKQISTLRSQGYGYIRIARELELSENTVKSYCRRHGLSVDALQNMAFCRNCGQPIVNREKRKPRQFCANLCRIAWWKEHPDSVNKKAVYSFTCAGCGKQFTAYGNNNRKYCCHDCYIGIRFGESVTAMNNDLYMRTQGYCSPMEQAKQMLSKGLIFEDEYAIIDTMMAEKYGLPSFSLFRDSDLLYKETDGNMSHYEEVTKCQKNKESIAPTEIDAKNKGCSKCRG